MSVHRADGSGLRDEALQPSIRGASCIGRARARRLDGLSSFRTSSAGEFRLPRTTHHNRHVAYNRIARAREGEPATPANCVGAGGNVGLLYRSESGRPDRHHRSLSEGDYT
jgi:hypothetical protein